MKYKTDSEGELLTKCPFLEDAMKVGSYFCTNECPNCIKNFPHNEIICALEK